MKRLVLVGGGHAHLPALARADQLRAAGARVTLVAPGPYHYYSGMGPGLLGGTYGSAQARIAVKRLARSRGVEFVAGKVAAVDHAGRTLTLEDGTSVPFDLVSFNTGSRVPVESVGGGDAGTVPVKPVENLVHMRERLLSDSGREQQILVVGGGPAGVEVAANLSKLASDHRLALSTTLTDAGGRLLARMPSRARRIAHQALTSRGVSVRLNCPIASLGENCASTPDGIEMPYDHAVVTIGIVPHPIFKESGLPTAEDGGLLVDQYLQAVGHPGIFGGGDCVSLAGNPLPRIGVYAIRQGPVLLENLLASVRGTPLSPFRPQRRALLILNLGDGTGLVVWGPLVWRGRLGFTWKNHLDKSFMQRFQLCGEMIETQGE